MPIDGPVVVEGVRYAAALPWIGPVLGALEKDGTRWVGAASDPAQGLPLAVLFVPVKIVDGKAQVVNLAGGKPELIQAARLGWFRSDANGRFRVATQVDGLPKDVGLLMAVLYDRSGALLDVTDADPQRYSPTRWELHATKNAAKGEEPLADLPEDKRDEIVRRITALLEMAADKLEEGIIRAPLARMEASRFTFAVASCQYPAGFLDRYVAQASYGRLAGKLASGQPVRCLLLVGDQIYSDATAGLFDPIAKYDRYDLPHERLLRGDALRAILRRIPLFAMLDDHEIKDNWEPLPDATKEDEVMVEGRQAYLTYQRIAGPEQRRATDDSANPLWYRFKVDGFHFFMADTRTERQARTVETIDTARIMSPTQFRWLCKWLCKRHLEDPERPKFIASPACLLPRHRRAGQRDHVASALQSDSWSGYPRSLHELLAHITEHQMQNVVFLSGDEHISFDATIMLTEPASGKQASIRSIHSSGLYSPFPFGNSIQEELAEADRAMFEINGKEYRWQVQLTQVAPGDGFSLVHAARFDRRWTIICEFDRARRAAFSSAQRPTRLPSGY